MRAGRVVMSIVTTTVFATAVMAPVARSAPIQAGAERAIRGSDLRRVSDSEDCWWWGTRWQYGWRGYGWYLCSDPVKPVAPVVVAPEAVPPDAITTDACLQRWQDGKGNWHTRRVC